MSFIKNIVLTLISLSLLITPELTTNISVAKADDTNTQKSLKNPPVILEPSLPTSSEVHTSLDAQYESYIDEAEPDFLIESKNRSSINNITSINEEDIANKIEKKYKEFAKKNKIEINPVVLSKAQIKNLMVQGALIDDIYELAFLSSEQKADPFELYQEKIKYKRSWEEFREYLMKKSNSTVSDTVYLVNDSLMINTDMVSVNDNVYSVTDSLSEELKVINKSPITALSLNINNTIKDFDMQVINQSQKPQYSESAQTSELIDPSSGSLTWKENQISLPGRDGLDLNIGLIYSSNQAAFMNPATDYYNYNNTRYDLGTGWGLRFPSVEDMNGSLYYHDGEGGIYHVDFEGTGALESYTHLKGYKGKDIKFMKDTNHSFNNGDNYSNYYLEYADKKREYYGGINNSLLGIVDRYGNTITFKYNYISSTYTSLYLLSEITDSVGRKIIFQYDQIDNRPLATDQQSAEEKLIITVQDLDGKESQKITYTRSRIGFEYYVPNSRISYWQSKPATILKSITNQNGEKTLFSYKLDYARKDPVNKALHNNNQFQSGLDKVVNLTEVKHDRSVTKYNYDYYAVNYGPNGYATIYKVTERYDQILRSGAFTGNHNHVNYEYEGSYDGYPKYFDDNTEHPAESWTYSSISKQQFGNGSLNTKSTFDSFGRMLSTEKVTSKGEKTVNKNVAFNSLFNKPTISEFWVYGVGDTDSSAKKISTTEVSYDDWGSVLTETQPLTDSQRNDNHVKIKNTTTYSYEPVFHFLATKSWYSNVNASSPYVENYTYNNLGRISSYSNPLNEITIYTYESTPNDVNKIYKVIQEKKIGSKIISKEVTYFGSDTKYAYPTEKQQYMNINLANQQVKKTKMVYDMGSGKVIEERDSNDLSTSYQYDSLGRINKISYPTVTNVNGEKFVTTEEINYYNNQVHSGFDSENSGKSTLKIDRITTLRQIATGETMVTYRNALYDGLGLALMEEQWDETVGKWTNTQYHYDDWGRPIFQVDQAGNVNTASYDEWSNQNKAVDAYGNIYVSENNIKDLKRTSYFQSANSNEKLNYVEKISDLNGNLISSNTYKDWPETTRPINESYSYDIVGNVIGFTDAKKNLNGDGVTTSYSYDALNRLISVKDALDQTTSYTYDGNGQVTKVMIKDSNGNSEVLSSKTYNELGLLTEKKDELSKIEVQQYNTMGLVSQKSDRNGTVTNFKYDELGQVKTISLGTPQLEGNQFIFGDGGVRYRTNKSMKNGQEASQQYYVDSFGRNRVNSATVNNHSAYIRNSKNSIGQTTQINDYYLNFYINYQYDKLRLATVQTNGISTLDTSESSNVRYRYFANGQVQSIIYPRLTDGSFLSTDYSYNKALNWVTKVTNRKGNEIISEYSYEYDNNGNIIQTTKETKNKENIYVKSTDVFVYDKLNRLSGGIRAVGDAKRTSYAYTYDLKGNRLTSKDSKKLPISEVQISYKFDLKNTLESVTKGELTTSFVNYADGSRYLKKTGNTWTQYNYNFSGQVITEENSSGEKANYVRGDRILVKKDVKNPSAVKDYYYLYNGHGDVVQIVDKSGTLLNTYDYDEWGNITSQIEGIPNSFKYAGEMLDEETGLYYLKARYYDPKIGRFINEDTYEGQIDNPLSLNLYTYVHNNPLKNIDPTGNYCISKDGKYSHAGDVCSSKSSILIPDKVYKQGNKAVQNYFLDPIKDIGKVSVDSFGNASFALSTAVSAPSTFKAVSTPKITANAYALAIGLVLSELMKPKSDDKSIYRWTHQFDNQSLTVEPQGITKQKMKGGLFLKLEDDEALSFSTSKGTGWVTTMNAVNSTGILYAVQDGKTHVSIRPTPWAAELFGDVDDWLKTYNNANTEPHFYTVILRTISAKNQGPF